MDRIATFHVVRERRGRQLLVMARMMTDRCRLRRVDGLVFAKVLGTGRGEHTGPSADLRRQAYFLVWQDAAAANAFRDGHPIARRWRSLAVEHDLELGLIGGHGTWSGRAILDEMSRRDDLGARAGAGDDAGHDPSHDAAEGDVIVLTRARIRPRSWRAFHRASRRLADNGPGPFWRGSCGPGTCGRGSSGRVSSGLPGRRWALGVGELPVGLLGTVSCWRSAADLDAWLRSDQSHTTAAAYADEWFTESLFARFAVLPSRPDDGN